MRGSRRETGEYIQCEEANAAGVPGDNIVSSLEKRADVLSVLLNEIDSRTAGPTYDEELG